MTQPTAQSVLRNRAAVAEELRRLLPKMEGFRTARSIPFGLAAIDRCLPQGGLACGALHEIVPEAGATPAAFGFLGALLAHVSCPPPERGRPIREADRVGVIPRDYDLTPPRRAARVGPPLSGEGKATAMRAHKLILVLPAYGLRDYGRPHGHGLNALGLPPHRLILVETAHRKDTLWAMEEALHSRAPAAVAGIIDQLDLKTSQRLHLAATDCGLPLLLLRPAETLESSAAATRWRVGAAPAARDRFGLITRARWQLLLERCRNGRTGEWMVEYDHVAHRFSLAAALADPAVPRSTGETRESEQSFRRAS
ncbi:MAG: ImuA family protein [Xanthobacteraceae bacterium]